MKRFLRELRFFISQIRDGYPRQVRDDRDREVCRRLMAMQFPHASGIDIHEAAMLITRNGTCGSIDLTFGMLLTRCGRSYSSNATTVLEWARRQTR